MAQMIQFDYALRLPWTNDQRAGTSHRFTLYKPRLGGTSGEDNLRGKKNYDSQR